MLRRATCVENSREQSKHVFDRKYKKLYFMLPCSPAKFDPHWKSYTRQNVDCGKVMLADRQEIGDVGITGCRLACSFLIVYQTLAKEIPLPNGISALQFDTT